MSYSVVLPNGQIVSGIDDAYTREEALRVLRQKMPQAFANEEAEVAEAPKPRKGGVMGSLGQGWEQFTGSSRTGIEALMGDAKQAALAGEKRDLETAAKYVDETGLAKIEAAYDKGGFPAAVAEFTRQVPHFLAQNAPQMVASILAAKTGAALGTLVLPGLGTAAGAVVGGVGALMPSYIGTDVQREGVAQRERGEAINPNVGSAVATAGAQAALDFVSLKMMGGKVLSQWMGLPVKTAADELKKAAERSILASAGVGARRGLVEIPTEVAQAILERANAGLPLLNDEALAEYGENALGAAAVGPSLGSVGGVTDRYSAKAQVEEQRRAAEIKADTEKRAADAAFKASPEYLNSVSGLEAAKSEAIRARNEAQKAFSAAKKAAKRGDILPGDLQAAEEKLATAQAGINELNTRIETAKKTPEQFMVDSATALGSEVTKPEAKPAAPTEEEVAPGVFMPKKVGEPQADAYAPQYRSADAQDAFMLSVLDPQAYALWQKQSQRDREAGLLPNMEEPGQLPQPVEDMAPVIGPNGTITGYRPITPEERAVRPPFELGVQMPAPQQQELGLPAPAPVQPAPALPKTEAPRIATNFASAAPMAPAVSATDLNEWRAAVPGQDISPRPTETIPPDAVAPPVLPPQGELALGDTADALAAAVARRGEGAQVPLPRALQTAVQKSQTAIVNEAGAKVKDEYANLTMLLDDLRTKQSSTRWKYDSPEGVEARNPNRAALRPEITTPLKRQQLKELARVKRDSVVQLAVREVVEKRQQMGLRPMTQGEVTKLRNELEALVGELYWRSTNPPKPTPTPKPKQRFVWDKGAIRTPQQAKSVQDAIIRIRNTIAERYREVHLGRHKLVDWAALGEEIDALEAREEALSIKLQKYFAGPSAQGKVVVRPWTGAKEDNTDLAMERPFGKPRAAKEAIFEQIKRVQDRALQTPRGPQQRVANPFELGKQYLDPKLAPVVEPAGETFDEAALEAEVTGRQKTLFGKELPSRGAGINIVRMFQGKWRKQQSQLKDTLQRVGQAIQDLGTENLNVATQLSRLRVVKASMDRLTKLLNGDKYGPAERKKIEALAENVAESLRLQKALRTELEASRQQDVVAMNLGLADAVGNEAATLPTRRPSTVESQTTKDLAVAEKFASLELKKAEMAFEPYVELNTEIGNLLEQYEIAKSQFSTLQELLDKTGTVVGAQRAAALRVNTNVERARKALGDSVAKADAAVTQAAEQVKDTKRRFDIPAAPAQVQRPQFPVVTPFAREAVDPETGATVQLRTGKTALADPEIARMAAAGFEESGKRRFPGEKALRDAAVQKRAFEQQTGQPGYFAERVAEAKKQRRASKKEDTKLAQDMVDLNDELGSFEPSGFDYTPPNEAVGDTDTAFRTGRAATAITPGEATELAAKAQKLIPNLVYVPTFSQMTKGLATQIAKDGGDPRAVKGGVLRDGTVFIVGEAHADAADFDATVAHELVGHYKMDRILFGTKTGYQMMQEIAAKHIPDEAAARNLMVELGFTDSVIEQVLQDGRDAAAAGQDGNVRNLREIVARTAEMKPGTFGPKAKSFWKSVVQWFKNAMRSFGVNVGDLTADDVHFLVKSALNGEVRTAQGSDTAFRTAVVEPENIRAIPHTLYPDKPGKVAAMFKNNMGLSARTQYVDRFAPIVAVSQRMADALRATQLVYFVRMADRVNQLVAEAMTNGPVSLVETADKKGYLYQSSKGVNIRDILRTLKGHDFRRWATYMALERAEAMPDGYNKLFGDRADAYTPEQRQALLEYGRATPAFQLARDQYKQYNNALVDFALKTGAITAEEAVKWKAVDYIPYYRKDDMGEVRMMGEHPIKIGNIRDQKDIASLFGSDKDLDDPFANISRNTRLLLGNGIRNQAAKNTAYELQHLGLGEFTKGDLRGAAEFGRNVIHFKDHGRPRSFIIQTDKSERYADIPGDLLAKGMEGIATQLPDMFKFMGVPARILRDFITRNPLYVVRQLIRDPMHAYMTTGADFTSTMSAFRKVGNLFAGKDAEGNLLRERGLVGGQVFQGTDDDMAKIMAQVHSGHSVAFDLLAKVDDMSVAADAATRVALYNDFKGKGMSDLEATLATMDSINFATRGASPTIQAINMVVPFFNAQIQGIDSVYRAMSGQMPFNDLMKARSKLAQRATMLVASTIIYYALVEDEDWYKNTPENIRMTNWLLPPMPALGIKEPIRIPIPFELGLLFKATPEAAMIASEGDPQAKAAWTALRNAAINNIPGGSSGIIPLPQAIKPLIEAQANHSFYTGRNIVPAGMEDAPGSEQFTLNTTTAARQVSSKLADMGIEISPMVLEHLVRGYTAGIGLAALTMLDGVLSPTDAPKPERPLSRTALVGPLFQQIDGPAVINRAYDAVNRINGAKTRITNAIAENRGDDAQRLAQENPEYALATYAGRFRKEMGDLTKLEKQVHFAPASSGLTSEEKTELLKKLRQAKIEKAKQFEALASQLQ